MKKKILAALLLILSVRVFSQNSNLICNGNFETPVIFSSPGMSPVSSLSCWQTTAPDQIIELWQSGFNLVPSFSGNQFLELNANYVSTIYQDFYASPGSNLKISFAHRGRAGIDTLSLEFGNVGGPYTSLGYFADDNTNWGYYTVYATVPNPGNLYRIRFVSVYATLQLPSVGNFLDSVTVQYSKTAIHETSSLQQLTVFPNPFLHTLNIILPESSNDPADITVSDVHGRTVYHKQHPVIPNQHIRLELPDLTKGFYFLKVTCSKNKYHQKIMRLE